MVQAAPADKARARPPAAPGRRVCGVALVALVASLLLHGCAGPGQAVTQTLRVETPGCEAAACELRNDRGQWRLPRTPGSVTLQTSAEPLQVSCRGADGTPYDTRPGATRRPPTGAGAVTGGVAGGAAAGLAVGAPALSFIPALGVIVVAAGVAGGAVAGQAAEASRSALRYPDVITVPMSCPGTRATPPSAPATPPLGLSVEGWPAGQVRAAGAGDRAAVRVTAVTPGGRAALAGLQVGDLILAADGQPLHDAAALAEHAATWTPGATVDLAVWRQGRLLALRLATGSGP